MLVIWTPRPWQRVLYWMPVVWILVVTWLSFESWNAMGLRMANFLRLLWVVGVALLIAAIAVLLAIRLRTLHVPNSPLLFFESYIGYAVWAFVQQILLLDFFLRRLLRLLPGRMTAVIVTAVIFALAHLPNPILTPVTLLWGLAACLLFLWYRNLYPLAMAHAICGICIAVTVPVPVSHNMRVGLGYLRYRPREDHQHNNRKHQRSQSDHIVSTQACVIADAPTRRC
jgi:membrane protease YdiL (CAAX protease family)